MFFYSFDIEDNSRDIKCSERAIFNENSMQQNLAVILFMLKRAQIDTSASKILQLYVSCVLFRSR